MGLLATPLGWLMKGCYMLIKNYGLALLLFTIVTRLITLPFNIMQQKSTAKMSMIQPEIDKLKKKYGKNQEKLNEETMKLYSDNHINPMASCLPMVITLVLLWALIPVVYKPLTYISSANDDHVSTDSELVKNLYTISTEVDVGDGSIEKLIEKADGSTDEEITASLVKTLSDSDSYSESAKVLEDLDDDEKAELVGYFVTYDGLDEFMSNSDNFTKNLMSSTYGPEALMFNFKKSDGKYMSILHKDVQQAIKDIDYTIFGLGLGKIPTSKDATVVIPFASFILQLLTTIVSQIFSRRNNPSMKMNGSMMAMLLTMPLISLWIGFKFPCALGIYWIYSSLIGFLQMIFLNLFYSPKKIKELAQKDIEKAKKKRKEKGPSFMERAIEIKNEQESESKKTASSDGTKKKTAKYTEFDDDDDKKLSKSQIKEQNRQKLNEARRRYAEKYGDDYTE